MTYKTCGRGWVWARRSIVLQISLIFHPWITKTRMDKTTGTERTHFAPITLPPPLNVATWSSPHSPDEVRPLVLVHCLLSTINNPLPSADREDWRFRWPFVLCSVWTSGCKGFGTTAVGTGLFHRGIGSQYRVSGEVRAPRTIRCRWRRSRTQTPGS